MSTPSAGDKIIQLPDGRRINLSLVGDYAGSSTNLVFTYTAGGTATYAAGSSGELANAIGQVDLIMTNGRAGVNMIGVLALVWTSITPNTGAAFMYPYAATIVGTGFITSGITTLKLDDGVGNVVTFTPGTITSDTSINAYWPIGPAGTYTLYFSTNGGSSYTTTGLTVTIS